MKWHPSTSSWIACIVLVLSGCGGVSHNILTSSLGITTQDAPAGATTVQYNGENGFTLAATGGTPPYKWSWAPAPNSDMPPGLALNGNRISGAPQSSGDFRVVVTVTDSGHPAAQASATYTVAVDAPLKITSDQPPSGNPGFAYGPIGTIYIRCVWSPAGGVHQVCTRCDPSISGSCPANRTNCSYPQTCTKTVQGHAGFTFTATGGAAPYTWSGTGLPPGLGLYPKFGIMSGTPTTAGTYSINVTVRDSEPTPQKVQSHYNVLIRRGGCSTSGNCGPSFLPPCCPGYVCVPASTRAFCEPTSSETPGGQSLSVVPPLRLDRLPEITFPLADSAHPQ